MTIGEKIRIARFNSNLSQNQLAKKIGTTQTVIARYESNTQSPTVKRLLEIAKATKEKPSWFLENLE